jgi:serine/threonine protein kinase
MSESHQREAAIFDATMELAPEQREAHLDRVCGGDAALRQRIEALVKACESTSHFLDSPAAPVTVGPTNVLPSSLEKAGDPIGRYKLLQQIGEGGCGVVYMAEQAEPLRRRVALKIIKLGMDTKSVIARFEAERQALAMMDHPNIAKVFDAGATETGRPYFVMELVRGMKITDYSDEKKLSTRARLDLFIQVCQAIQHAHQKGIIHRDIKPSNILVTVNDGMPVPKVIDFGIAKATSGQQLTDKTLFTAFEQFIGTPAYMSPEQAVLTSVDIDTRSDIYALGVLLYELLTGKTPFDAQELMAVGLDEMRRTICEQEPPRPSTRLSTLSGPELSTTAQHRGLDAPKLVSELRGDLDWIVMKALEKDRARRYETANGLAMDIQRYLNCEPVTARPPSNLYRLQRAVRRNKLAFTAAVAVVAALVIGLGLSTWLFLREREALERAELREVFLRARFLVGEGRSERADQLWSDLVSRAPNSSTILRERAEFRAQHGRWKEAAADFARVIQLRSEVDHETPYYDRDWHSLATLLIQSGDVAGYREHCRKSVELFGETHGVFPAHQLSKACLTLPDCGVDVAIIARLSEASVARGPGAGGNWEAGGRGAGGNWGAFLSNEALAKYRQGRFASAVERVEKTLAYEKEASWITVETSATLAMARYQLNQVELARTALMRAQDDAKKTLPKLDSADLGANWIDVIICDSLLREAKALIEGPAQTTGETR